MEGYDVSCFSWYDTAAEAFLQKFTLTVPEKSGFNAWRWITSIYVWIMHYLL